MEHVGDIEREEKNALHRTHCAVGEVVARLKVMGLYQMTQDQAGNVRPVDLDPRQRRDLLVYVSELEDLVQVLEGFKRDLARDIDLANRGMNAVSVYRRAGTSLTKSARAN